MVFANPLYLLLLLLIIPVVVWYVLKQKRMQASLQVSTTQPFAKMPRTYKIYLRHFNFVLRVLAVAFLIIALARPQSTDNWQNSSTEGVDIVLALDISGSMLARDFKPDRVEAAKDVAAQFVSGREHDNIGLVIFAGESFTMCPMTTDHAVLLNLMKDVHCGMVDDGTAIGDGLATAINRIKDGPAKSKTIILLTDGTNNAGDIAPATAAQIAKSFGIHVYTIGVGTKGLAPTPVQTPYGITYQNMPVEMDEDALKQIAATADGKYFRATSKNVLKGIFDEIDKLGQDFKGDPSSALLEVLDPEQNSHFHDNYVDLDFDLSKILFIATANSLSELSQPLLDRMEIIEINGYIQEEKIEIARKHLIPKQLAEHGFAAKEIDFPKATIAKMIDEYTRESGVRQLDKTIAKVLRRIARLKASNEEYPTTIAPEQLKEFLGPQEYFRDKYEGNEFAGVVTGLAWTAVGGEILFVESSISKGKGEKLTLTGNLGDVMKESAIIALQYLKAHSQLFGIDYELFDKYNIHIHVPEGAIPKDGPSAGVTMVTSLVSTFTQRKVRPNLAMTGEITLRGKVLPVGGIKEKILAAKRAGIVDIVLCKDNRKDVEEIKESYLKGLNFHYVNTIKEVIDIAILPEKIDNAMEL